MQSLPQTSRDTFEELANTVLAVGSVGMVPIKSSFASLFAEAESLKSTQIVPLEFVARITTKPTIEP